MKKVEITIPILNEEKTLSNNIREIYSYCEQNLSQNYQWTIIIADNGSKDKSPLIGCKLAEDLSNIIYIREKLSGVGRALKSSWKNSNADIIGYMDLDLSVPLENISRALEPLNNQSFDIVYGSRLHRDSIVIGRSMKREVISRIFNLIVQKYMGTTFSDGMCGFKFLNRKYLSKLMEMGAVSDGWFFCTEILIVGEFIGLNLLELPVVWNDNSESQVKIFPLSIEYLKALRKLKIESK